MTFKIFQIVVVPFPFTEKNGVKKRPAIVISQPRSIHKDRSLFAMVTSSRREVWPLDVELTDWHAAGLAVPCLVRLKVFTMDHALVIRNLGVLSDKDSRSLQNTLAKVFS